MYFINNYKNYFDIKYVIFFFVLFILILIGVYKIKFQFWSKQPVLNPKRINFLI